MKKNVTYLPASAIEAIVTELNLPMVAQAGFIKVAGAKGRQVYIAKTKTVGRIDISGFHMEHLGVRDLGDASFGAVEQQVNFEGSPEVILGTIKDVLETMLTLPAKEKAVKEAKAPKAEVTKTEKPAKVAKAKAEPKPEPKKLLPRTREERQKLRDANLCAALEAAQAKVDAEAVA